MHTIPTTPIEIIEAANLITYPESDGTPMGETDTHRDVIAALIEMLKDRYRNDPQTYVSGNLFIYYEKGNPSAVFSPDAFVVFGIPKQRRRTYKLWKKGNIAPAVVFEITSKGTWLEDEGTKMALCRRLGVREYFMFDPLHEYLEPPLQGYRLTQGQYIPIPSNAEGELHSKTLDLQLRPEKHILRMIDTQTGQALLTPLEAQTAHRTEAKARREAEAEVERLQAELEKMREEK